MAQKTPEQVIINHDIMRYKKNKWAQLLALLGLAFNCLYFMLLYAFTGTFYYDSQTSKTAAGLILIGVSVILTLVILLVTFLSSENIKNYRKSFSYVLLGIAVIQILRIFGMPLWGLNHQILTVGYFGFYPTPEQSWIEFTIMTVYLCASAACLIGAAVIGWIQSTRLEKYMHKVESGEVDIINVIKKLDAEDAENAVQTVSDPVIDAALKEVNAETDEPLKSEPEATEEEALPTVSNEEVE